jgi:hypothetical protein
MTPTGIIDRALTEVPTSVAAAIVDVASGKLLDLQTADGGPGQLIDLDAGTRRAVDGDVVARIEEMYEHLRTAAAARPDLREMLLASTNLWCYFGRLESTPDAALAVVCRADADLGRVLDRCRAIRSGDLIRSGGSG